ncbi:ornithine carbamoyltransferase [Cytobacillus sp. Hz8]|uniref:ornithine carbamoyltransferase n=1 Tax=Cytobacillus sp. Hz8 TaxID=3347168 RepID=UPI0035E344A9
MMSTSIYQPNTNLKGKDLLTLADISSETIQQLLLLAGKLKRDLANGERPLLLKGKILGMIFDKPSTRTRVSFEAGMVQLGGHAMYLNGHDLQMGRGETIEDTAKVLSEYVDGIMIRTFSHQDVEELAKHASIPIINGLTDMYHPCQALADLLTMQEVKGELKGLKLAYMGDGNNVAHSLLIACAKMGVDIAVAAPEGYQPHMEVVNKAKQFALESGSNVTITTDPLEAVNQADAVYGDVWTSMGQEAENEIRLHVFKNYQINEKLVEKAKADYIFLHCLPAHRGEEVTADVIDGKHSYIYQQAGNRLHAQKALLVEILK